MRFADFFEDRGKVFVVDLAAEFGTAVLDAGVE